MAGVALCIKPLRPHGLTSIKARPDPGLHGAVRDPKTGLPERAAGSARHTAAIDRARPKDVDPMPSPFAERLLWAARRFGFAAAKRHVLIGDGAKWIWNTAAELPNIHFDRHLYYQPLLVQRSAKVTSKPPALNESERRFVEDLRDYCRGEKDGGPSAPTRLNWCVSGSRKFPGKARSRADVPGRTSSGRNAAGGLPAATRRARPQASARFVAASRSMARYTFETCASRSDACERADASIQPSWSTRPSRLRGRAPRRVRAHLLGPKVGGKHCGRPRSTTM